VADFKVNSATGTIHDLLKDSAAELFENAGFAVSANSPFAEAMERLESQPTINIEGLVAGYTGPGGKTVLPHRAEAKLDLRLVPDMTAEAALAPDEYFVIESINPEVEGWDGAVLSYVKYLYELAK